MKIVPNQKRLNTLFYNNLLLICALFCILCFLTSLFFQNGASRAEKKFHNLQNDALYGPIVVGERPQVYKIILRFYGNNAETYVTGEVLDKDKDVLYEFGKDLWHASGRDSDGEWQEATRDLTAHLTFSEKGEYYIQFNAEAPLHRAVDNPMQNITLTVKLVQGSYIAHLKAGSFVLLAVILLFCMVNSLWLRIKLAAWNDRLEED
jgi:hypothetical protein